jgi:hypothetical protein
MTLPLMPKATAVWLVENTSLTFEQIANFCGLHPLEVKGIADGEVAVGIVGLDPVAQGQLTAEELARCEADPSAQLTLLSSPVPQPKARTKGARYTPVSKRGDRPDAIAWILKYHPEISDAQIQKLLGTTKATIAAVRDRTHWNAPNIKPRDPVSLGICSQLDLDRIVQVAQKKKLAREKREDQAARAAAAAASKSDRAAAAAAPVAPERPEPEPEAAPDPAPQGETESEPEPAKRPEPSVESVFGPPRGDDQPERS